MMLPSSYHLNKSIFIRSCHITSADLFVTIDCINKTTCKTKQASKTSKWRSNRRMRVADSVQLCSQSCKSSTGAKPPFCACIELQQVTEVLRAIL